MNSGCGESTAEIIGVEEDFDVLLDDVGRDGDNVHFELRLLPNILDDGLDGLDSDVREIFLRTRAAYQEIGVKLDIHAMPVRAREWKIDEDKMKLLRCSQSDIEILSVFVEEANFLLRKPILNDHFDENDFEKAHEKRREAELVLPPEEYNFVSNNTLSRNSIINSFLTLATQKMIDSVLVQKILNEVFCEIPNEYKKGEYSFLPFQDKVDLSERMLKAVMKFLEKICFSEETN